MTTIYHVTTSWDGDDLLPLADQIDSGELDLDAALESIASKWFGGDVRMAERYLDGDGHFIHFHATREEAVDFRDEWMPGGVILAVEADGLAVEVGEEYTHPVIRDAVPASLISEG